MNKSISKAGLGILDAIEIGNEWNFPASWSEAKATLTPQEYAVMFMVCYDAIRSVSENIEIIIKLKANNPDLSRI